MEGVAILIAVFICSVVAATNDYQKARRFQELYDIENRKRAVQVVRSGKRCSLHPDELVVGDLVLLAAGMEVQGDGFLVEACLVEADESSMTGESEPVKKDVLHRCVIEKEREESRAKAGGPHTVSSPVLLAGTKVAPAQQVLSGEGKYVVINVGPNSAIGKITSMVTGGDDSSPRSPETPLQLKLEDLADKIGKFGLFFAVLTLVALLVRLLLRVTVGGERWDKAKHPARIVRAIIIAVGLAQQITVVVVAIPEGLPLAVTLSLAYSVKEMLKENNLVRKLHACETMGGADSICSDKTGTLTQNEMFLTRVVNDRPVRVFDMNSQESLDFLEKLPKQAADLFVEAILANSSEDLVASGHQKTNKGSKTGLALLKYLASLGVDVEAKRREYHIAKRIPFSSNRKRMSTVISTADNQNRLYIKGASELLLSGCTHFHSLEQVGAANEEPGLGAVR